MKVKGQILRKRSAPGLLRGMGLFQLPHVSVFLLVNLAYCVPVLLAYALSFSEGGVAETLDVGQHEMFSFANTYFWSVVSFYVGAILVWKLPLKARAKRLNARPYADFSHFKPPGVYATTAFVCIALVATKILLIPAGVYSTYAFDGDLMSGGMWTASMFFSETLIILLLAILIIEKTILSKWFVIAFICLSTNLLHGTRIFDTAAILAIIVYYSMTVGFTKKMMRNTVLGLAATFVALYIAFSTRTDYQYSSDASGLTVALSPVVYESVFSQMSLIRFLESGAISLFGHPVQFLVDAISFVLPRFINPNKDTGGLLESYADLSPLGAFSGHAAGLIYFGYSMFFVYFLLGALGSWLQRRAKQNSIFFAVYLYFTGDILFRLMRDGIIYPVKYFLDSVIILVFSVLIFKYWNGRQARRNIVSIDAQVASE